MHQKGTRLAGILTAGLLLLSGCSGSLAGTGGEAPVSGYLDVTAWQTAFLAAGSQGRVDLIRMDGQAEPIETGTEHTFWDVAASGEHALAVGAGGTVLSLDAQGETQLSQLRAGGTLLACTSFQDYWYVGGTGGLFRDGTQDTWEEAQLELEGTITGLAANGKWCIGVTDAGETFRSADGITWSKLDYGEDLTFCGIEVCENAFWAFGTDSSGESHVVTTVEGGVWSDRGPLGVEGNEHPRLTGLTWDGQQTVASCWDGAALTLPGCTECNLSQTVCEGNLTAVACQSGTLLFVGADYAAIPVETEQTRQHQIKPAAALALQQEGALVVDVRSAEEYAQRHIAGSVHMDDAQTGQTLPELCPDRSRPVIFYCKSGTRSQAALETALQMGYEEVYNLGAMENWPYGYEGEDPELT